MNHQPDCEGQAGRRLRRTRAGRQAGFDRGVGRGAFQRERRVFLNAGPDGRQRPHSHPKGIDGGAKWAHRRFVDHASPATAFPRPGTCTDKGLSSSMISSGFDDLFMLQLDSIFAAGDLYLPGHVGLLIAVADHVQRCFECRRTRIRDAIIERDGRAFAVQLRGQADLDPRLIAGRPAVDDFFFGGDDLDFRVDRFADPRPENRAAFCEKSTLGGLGNAERLEELLDAPMPGMVGPDGVGPGRWRRTIWPWKPVFEIGSGVLGVGLRFLPATCRGVNALANRPPSYGVIGTSARNTSPSSCRRWNRRSTALLSGLFPARKCWPRTCTGMIASVPNWNSFSGLPAPSPSASHLQSEVTVP